MVKKVLGVRLKAKRRRCDVRIPHRVDPNASQLLPGLQNDIVLKNIVPKLPWRAFHVLSSVSPHWRDAITTLQVYDARIQSNALEKLVICNHPDSDYDYRDANAISMFSMRDDRWHQLPKFPFYKQGIPPMCECAAMDGRFYVIGGTPHEEDEDGDSRFYVIGGTPHDEDEDEDDEGEDDEDDRFCYRRPQAPKTSREVLIYSDGRPQVPNTGSEVFVLDLVGQRGWKRCADLPGPKQGFACAVLDGKIYLLGGVAGTSKYSAMGGYTRECLMYHPNEDRWSSIAPMIAKRGRHHAVVVGGKLWVHGGDFGWRQKASYSEVYDPAEDKWSRVETERCHKSEHLFTVSGKPYLMTPDAIYGLDEASKRRSWTHKHSVKLTFGLDDDNDFEIVAAQAVDDELLTLFEWSDARESQIAMHRSKGFGTEKEQVEFEVPNPGVFEELQCYPDFMCPIEL